jgi:hypothetical protein
MTAGDPDRDLREAFTRLREEERARHPSFQATLDGVARRRARRARLASARRSAAAIAAAVALVAGSAIVLERTRGGGDAGRPPGASPAAVSVGIPKAPTDFLLITPGSEMLRSVPTFGWPDEWTTAAPPPDDRARRPAAPSHRRTPS